MKQESHVDNNLLVNAEQIEQWLVKKIAKHMNLSADNIRVKEPFVNYGIDSSVAVLIATELEEMLGQSIPSTVMWEYPTIYDLANYLGNEGSIQYHYNPISEQSESEPIAIVGMACRFPGAKNLEEYWEILSCGKEVISEVPSDRFEVDEYYDPNGVDNGKMFTKHGGFIEDIDKFDYKKFGFTPREASYMDPQQRLLLELSWEALENAGIDVSTIAGSRTGVFIGASTNDYSQLVNDNKGINPFLATGNALSVISNRVSYSLDLKGPSLTVDTACSSSLVGVEVASQNILSGQCDMAIAGGVNVILTPFLAINYSQTGILSKKGHCRAFDAEADGFVRGEGAGVVILKRLSQAIKDNDRIYALIKGGAINQDGKTNGIMAPNRLSQEAVIQEACKKANISPGQIEYIEAHGTATAIGDRIEAEAISNVVGQDREPQKKCLIGSVKTNIGHLEAAAGIAGIIKVALSLWHQKIPPSINYNEPNHDIPFGQLSIQVHTELSKWGHERGKQYAGISSFGFAGTNCHIILSDFLDASNKTPESTSIEQSSELITLSAHNENALRDFVSHVLYNLKNDKYTNLNDLAYSLNVRRMHQDYRLAIPFSRRGELISKLEEVKQENTTSVISINPATNHRKRDLVYVFSGIDSRWKESASQLFEDEAIFRKHIEECDKEFRKHVSSNSLIVGLLQDKGLFEVDSTYSQTANFAVQTALYKLLESWGIVPSAVVGYGLGEISAAFVSGTLSLQDATLLTIQQDNLNKKFSDHNLLVEEQAELRDNLKQFVVNMNSSTVSFYSTIIGQEIVGSQLAISYWNRDSLASVGFNKTLEHLLENGFTTFIELSPHPSLVQQIEKQMNNFNIDGIVLATLNQRTPNRLALLATLGSLYTRGHNVNWNQLYSKGSVVSYPAYPWQGERCWIPKEGQKKYLPEVDKEELWNGLVQTGIRQSEQAPLDLFIHEYDDALVDFRNVVVDFIVAFFVENNIYTTEEESYTLNQLADQLSIHSHYRIVLGSWLDQLCQAGYLEKEGRRYVNLSRLEKADNDQLMDQLHKKYSSTRSLLELINNFGSNLTKLMQGVMDPLDILFPNGSFSIMEEIYQYSAEARYFNHIVSALVEKMAAQHSGSIRILEVGAGTGATSSFILPKLAHKQHHYKFTDISNLFFANAKRKFREYPFVTYDVLDVEKSPNQQGFDLHSYDVIIGANVLHATENLDITMKNVRSLLKSSSYLILWEVTRDQPWLDITFGLVDGWQRHNDRWRDDSPLISTNKWRELLKENEFDRTEEFPQASSIASIVGQNVIVARGPVLDVDKNNNVTNSQEDLSLGNNASEQDNVLDKSKGKTELLNQIMQAHVSEKKELILDFLQTQLAYLIGIPEKEIDSEFSMDTLGFDSMIALELSNTFIRELDVDVPLSSFLDSPSIDDLANNILELLGGHDATNNYQNSSSEYTPLSHGQKSMWVMYHLEPNSSLYNVTTALKIKGSIDREAFRRTIQKLVDRHQALRTTFSIKDNEPFQKVYESIDMPFEYIDASIWSKDKLDSVLNEEADKPFDIEKGPLWRLYIYSVSDEEYYFFLAMHHIITDGWSMWLFMHEINDIYEAEIKNLHAELPSLPLEYTDYTNQMYEILQSPKGKEMQEYWTNQLQGAPSKVTLNFQNSRPPIKNYSGSKLHFRLSEEQSKQVMSFSKSNGLTPYMTLLTTFGTLIFLYSNQKDFVVGSPVSGRTHPNYEGLMGYFINMLPIRMRMNENISIQEVLTQVKRTVLDAYDNQVYPFTLMVNDLQIPRDPSVTPLFQVAFVWQQANKPHAKKQGLAPFFLEEAGMVSKQGALHMESVPLDHHVSLFDLTFKMAEGASVISGMIEYSTHLYEKEYIVQLMSDFKKIIDVIVNSPETKMEELIRSLKLIKK